MLRRRDRGWTWSVDKPLHVYAYDVCVCCKNGKVEKTDPRSADYQLTPTPRTTLINRPFAWSGHVVRINHTGTQITQWDFQKKGTRTSPARRSFVLNVPLCNLGRVEKTDPRSADYPLTPTSRTTLRDYADYPTDYIHGLRQINNQIYVYGGKRHKKLTCSTYTTITVWKTAAIFFSPTSTIQSFFIVNPISSSATNQNAVLNGKHCWISIFLICFKSLPSTR